MGLGLGVLVLVGVGVGAVGEGLASATILAVGALGAGTLPSSPKKSF